MVGQVLSGSGEGPAAGFGEHVETQTFFISWFAITCTKKISITECQTTMAGLLKALLQAGDLCHLYRRNATESLTHELIWYIMTTHKPPGLPPRIPSTVSAECSL